MKMIRILVWLGGAALLLPQGAFGISEAEFRSALDQRVMPFMQEYCIRCHGPKRQKADFRVDTLGISQSPEDAEYWQLVLDNLHLGDMPPEDEDQPTIEELSPVTDWIEAELRRARRALAGHGSEVVLRRLNRLEYENTIEDLLGVRGEYAGGFPEDAKEEGFDNIGAALMLSSEQINQYLAAADFVLDRAIVTRDRPKTVLVETSLREIQRKEDERRGRNRGRGPYFPEHGEEDALIAVRFTKPDTRRVFQVRYPGFYRFKVETYAVRNEGKPIRLRVTSGRGGPDEVPELVDVIQVVEPELKSNEYRVYLQPNERIFLEMLDGKNWLPGPEIEKSPDVAIAIRGIEMEGPLIDEWPPRGHRNLVGEVDVAQLSHGDIPEVVRHFAPRLFRRPVDGRVIDEFVDLADTVGRGLRPLDALKLTLKAMMVSPHFIYHVEDARSIDAYAFASRLSYFLWRSMPDDRLLELASSGRLREPRVLREEVERMLSDPKAERFVNDFVGQWLRTTHVGEMRPDSNLYPEYDLDLEWAMVQETHLFFKEMLEKDLSITNLIDSDWTMLNDRLARHYGIDGVEGNDFRRVALDKSTTVRGGLLTHASILNVTSNGTTTSPVVRGVFVLDHILGTPAPPPPPDVPPIEPDIRGASTIKAQLEKHREIPQCSACHRKIDPYGLALENFDVIGGWREHYRALEPVGRNRTKVVDGKEVISNDSIPKMGSYGDFIEFRRILLRNEELVYHNMAHKLATYALGRTMDFSDREVLDRIVELTRKQGGGLRVMIHYLAQSPLFSNP